MFHRKISFSSSCVVQELQSYAVSEGEGKYETAVSHRYIGYRINVALAHEGLRNKVSVNMSKRCQVVKKMPSCQKDVKLSN